MSNDKLIQSIDFNKNPLWFKALNGVWKSTYPLGTNIKLDKDKLIQSARNHTGLKDFGKDFWDEPLERMLDSINKEAQLHPIGKFITKKRIENLLSVRLRAEDCFKKHPEILEQELYPVTVIVGLQRTGTTKLHRMMASDPDTRALLSWEAINPSPLNGDAKTSVDRIKMARMSEKALKVMSPGFFAIHPVEHLAPEEDVLLLDVSFLSTTAEATMNVPSYSQWLENTDQSSAYEYAAKLMKFLQWQRPAKRWVLKTPHHLEFLDLATKYFNDVQFVWTHRDALEAIPSFLSMVSYSRILFSDKVEPYDVAQHWVKKIGYMTSQAIDFRNKNKEAKFIDVSYLDLIQDSLPIMKRIYNARGIEINSELEETFRNTEQINPKGKYGVHKYKVEDFGIDQQFITDQTDHYQKFQKTLFNQS